MVPLPDHIAIANTDNAHCLKLIYTVDISLGKWISLWAVVVALAIIVSRLCDRDPYFAKDLIFKTRFMFTSVSNRGSWWLMTMTHQPHVAHLPQPSRTFFLLFVKQTQPPEWSTWNGKKSSNWLSNFSFVCCWMFLVCVHFRDFHSIIYIYIIDISHFFFFFFSYTTSLVFVWKTF